MSLRLTLYAYPFTLLPTHAYIYSLRHSIFSCLCIALAPFRSLPSPLFLVSTQVSGNELQRRSRSLRAGFLTDSLAYRTRCERHRILWPSVRAIRLTRCDDHAGSTPFLQSSFFLSWLRLPFSCSSYRSCHIVCFGFAPRSTCLSLYSLNPYLTPPYKSLSKLPPTYLSSPTKSHLHVCIYIYDLSRRSHHDTYIGIQWPSDCMVGFHHLMELLTEAND